MANMHQFVVPGEKYPRVSENMTEEDFQNWKNLYLQEYLADRSINKTGNKDVLAKNAYGAYCYLEEQEEIEKNCKENLILENGLVTLPDPVTLQDGWYSAPESLLNTVSDNLFLIMLLTIQVKIMLEKHAEVERVFQILNICQM